MEERFRPYGKIQVEPLSRIQQISVSYLTRNWSEIPHVTHHDEADIEELEIDRARKNAGADDSTFSLLSYLVKALAVQLKEFPRFNSSFDAITGKLYLKKYVNIGIAVDTPRGLLVPVLRDCDRKRLDEIASEISTISQKVRAKGASMEELAGGCMTISSLGKNGGLGFTPIINAPEVAILGVSRVVERPARSCDSGVSWRKCVPLSLSFDHRVINGADAARFMRALRATLALPQSLSSICNVGAG